ncbi:MAG TPA: PAS domain S-box protein, partial [Chroococcidiopsis sp.]
MINTEQVNTEQVNVEQVNTEPSPQTISQLNAEVRRLQAELMALKATAKGDRERDEQALKLKIEREHSLGVITQRIRHSLDLDEILGTAVQEVRRILQADRALIIHLRPDGTGVVVKESVSPGYPVPRQMGFADDHIPAECYQHYLHDAPQGSCEIVATQRSACMVEFMRQADVQSKLVASIIQRTDEGSTQVWGLLTVHACASPRQWHDDEADLLNQISDQIAIAIQQAELYRKLHDELAERKRIEEALRHSETLFRSLCECAPIGIVRIDTQNCCIYTNPRCQAIFGFTAAEALGDGWQQFVHVDDRERILAEWMAAANQEFLSEFRAVHRDGTIRLCQIKTVPVHATGDALIGHVGTVEDITERRAIEQIKNEFVSVVGHELRTPLASIRGSLGLLASGLLQDEPDTAQQMLAIAQVEAERLSRLINDMLDLERLESRSAPLDKQWCDAAVLINQAAAVVQSLAERDRITLALDTHPQPIWADSDRIIQTLVNLLSNAIKFSPPGTTISLTTQVQEMQVQERQVQEMQPEANLPEANLLEANLPEAKQVL